MNKTNIEGSFDLLDESNIKRLPPSSTQIEYKTIRIKTGDSINKRITYITRTLTTPTTFFSEKDLIMNSDDSNNDSKSINNNLTKLKKYPLVILTSQSSDAQRLITLIEIIKDKFKKQKLQKIEISNDINFEYDNYITQLPKIIHQYNHLGFIKTDKNPLEKPNKNKKKKVGKDKIGVSKKRDLSSMKGSELETPGSLQQPSKKQKTSTTQILVPQTQTQISQEQSALVEKGLSFQKHYTIPCLSIAISLTQYNIKEIEIVMREHLNITNSQTIKLAHQTNE